MFTPMKPTGFGMLNDTILNTPQPQATSTVQRKNTLESRLGDRDGDEGRDKQTVSYENERMEDSNSSLGLLDEMSSVLMDISTADEGQRLNYPNTDAELEFARRLLQRCSNVQNFTSNIDTNKENDANVQNIMDSLPAASFTVTNENPISQVEQGGNTTSLVSKTNNSVTFEPTEITARSSGLSKGAEKQFFLNKSPNGISFGATTAEIMAQFNDEEFLSGSQMAEQLSADEAYWQQNNTYAMPTTNTGKQELDLSAFSGIIGQLDLSIASCAGQKVSVGQYFKRKCGNIGLLEDNERIRPSLGFVSESPIKRHNLEPLVDSTVITNATSVESKEKERIPNMATDLDKNGILSLSSIANTLQDVHSGTPRRLVDQLLMAQKKKKYPVPEDRKGTYTLPTERKSMLAIPTTNVSKFDDEISLVNLSTKLSLDSRTMNDMVDIKQQLARMLSFASSKNTKDAEVTYEEKTLKDEPIDKRVAFPLYQNAVPDIKFLSNSMLSLSTNEGLNIPCVTSKMDTKRNDQTFSDIKIENIEKKEIKGTNISDNKMNFPFPENAMSNMQTDSHEDVFIGKNTEQLCNCIVGMTCEANIELINKGDKWITYSLKLNEIRGDKQSIALDIPQDATLIKPNGMQSTKIEVKVIKMCKPIIAVLNIIVSDMVAKSKWFMKHMICFNPEELELDVMFDSQKQELDFEYVAENSSKTLPIYLYNKNSVDMPIRLSILQDGLKMFSIDGSINGSARLNEADHLILKPQTKFSVGIICEGLKSMSMESSQRQPHYWKSKLIIQVRCNDGTILLVKEVPIYAQIGTCKIAVVDTDIPIIVPRQQSRSLNIVNSGNIGTLVSASFVSIEGFPSAAQDFSIKPDNIFLQTKERGSFLITRKSQILDAKSMDNERRAKVKLVAGNNVYYYLVSTERKTSESESENHLRCNTPSNFASVSSSTSPHSVISNRSPIYDRHSPSSTVSTTTVMGAVIPIKATHAALVWNSIKTGKTEIKEFTIRNTSNNKIKIQIDIWDDNKSFKFLGDRQSVNTGMVLALQRMESKTLSVIFSPYYVGPVTAKITIKHYTPTKENTESQQHKRISLYGYGGCAKVKIFDTFKDATGKMWLSLGTLSSDALRANIKLQNTGDLCSFAKIKVVPKVISPTTDSSWHINPKELILNPREARHVSIEFHPKREDFAMLQRTDVSHVATLNVTYGDEPTRWRIRRLYNKLKESNELAESENEAFKSTVHPLCKAFPGEQLIPGLVSIRDSVQNLSDLCTGVHQYEIMLTVEACGDDTVSVFHDTDDESRMYYSLINDNSHIDDGGGTSFFASQTIADYEVPDRNLHEDQLTVNPSTVILNPVQNEATVTILGFFNVAQPFQTSLSNSDYFSVVPSEGMLPSKRNFPLKIRCLQRIERNMQAVLEIYTENNKRDVLIKVNAK